MEKKIDSIYVELLSICKLKERLLQTKHVVPVINDCDKEPIWDGNLYLYSNSGTIKNDSSLLGRIPVQIKGTCCYSAKKSSLSYPIRVDDLKKYNNDGGVMYFVVAMQKNGGKFTIYYKTLLPFDILNILDSKETQETINVHMEVFPSNNEKICAILKNFIINKTKQGGTAKQGIELSKQLHNGKSLEELNISSFTFNVAGDIFGDINNVSKIYTYAKLESDIEVPIESGNVGAFSVSRYSTVSIGDEAFDCYICVHNSKKGKKLIIENSIFISEKNNQITFKFTTNINEIIKTLEIMKAMYNSKTISIGNFFKANIININLIGFDELTQKLNMYCDIKKVLEILNVNKNLSFENFSDEDNFNLRLLVACILYKKPFKISDFNINEIGTMTIGNITILLKLSKVDSDMYIFELLKSEHCKYSLSYDDKSEDKFPISAFSIFSTKDFETINNLPYNSIYGSIIDCGYFEETSANINLMALRMLSAYDSIKDKNLLDLAIKTFKWLYMNSKQSIHIINYFQSIKRKRILNDDERLSLIELKETDENAKCYDILFGIYTLLDNYEEAKFCLDKLSEDVYNELCKFPIFTMFKTLEEHKHNS